MKTEALRDVARRTRASGHYALANQVDEQCDALMQCVHELRHLVRLLEPLEKEGGLNVPGLATLNGARVALAKVLP